jgi:hypothetical protein
MQQQRQTQQPIILFYSNHCQYCKNLLLEIQQQNISNYFEKRCIDGQNVPPFVTKVPTLVLTNEQNKILEDETVFNYIKEFSFRINQQNNNMQQRQQQQQQQQNPHQLQQPQQRNPQQQQPQQQHPSQMTSQQSELTGAQGNQSGGPSAWGSELSSGFSDSYSFLGSDTSAEGNGGLNIKHSFGLLNGSNPITQQQGQQGQQPHPSQQQGQQQNQQMQYQQNFQQNNQSQQNMQGPPSYNPNIGPQQQGGQQQMPHMQMQGGGMFGGQGSMRGQQPMTEMEKRMEQMQRDRENSVPAPIQRM